MTQEELVAKVDAMQAEQTAFIAKNEAALAEATKRAERAEAITKLNADERKVFDALGADDQAKYLSDEAYRTEANKRAAPAEKPEDSTEVQKAVDAATAELKKRLDASEAVAAELKKQAEDAQTIAKQEREERLTVEFQKRAETELPNVIGTAVVKGKVLRAITEKLDKETGDELMKMLKSADAAQKALGKPVGSDIDAGSGDAWEQCIAKAKVIAKDRKITEAKALDIVSEQEPELYKRAMQEETTVIAS